MIVKTMPSKQAAEYLGISHRTLMNWTKKDLLAHIEFPRNQYRYFIEELENIKENGFKKTS